MTASKVFIDILKLSQQQIEAHFLKCPAEQGNLFAFTMKTYNVTQD